MLFDDTVRLCSDRQYINASSVIALFFTLFPSCHSIPFASTVSLERLAKIHRGGIVPDNNQD